MTLDHLRGGGFLGDGLAAGQALLEVGPISLSMFMNLPNTAITPFCSPVITPAHLGVPSGWLEGEVVWLVALNGFRKWTVMSTARATTR